jgi:phage terminase large subunit
VWSPEVRSVEPSAFALAQERWRKDPDLFFSQVLKCNLSDQQREIVEAVRLASIGEGPWRIAIKAAKGVGKSFVVGGIMLWWLSCWRSRVIATAPTLRQTSKVLMHEVRCHVNRSIPLLSKIVEVYSTGGMMFKDPTWDMNAFAARSGIGSQGWHHPRLAAFEDEASGVPQEIHKAIDDTMTNPHRLWIKIGNPNARVGPFYNCFTRSSRFGDGTERWKTFTLSALDSPFVSEEKIRDTVDQYGTDSDEYRVAILGEWPNQDPKAIVSEVHARICANLNVLDFIQPGDKAQIGFDVAGENGDECVGVFRLGDSVLHMEAKSGRKPLEFADRLMELEQSLGLSRFNPTWVVDAGGMGSPVVEYLIRCDRRVFPFHFGGRSRNSKEFRDKATEAWFNLGKRIAEHSISIPNDEVLIQQLVTRNYKPRNLKFQLEVESKDRYKDRGYDSPDRADALIMAYYEVPDSMEVFSVAG